jgi:CspA family cold shock protein
MAFKPKIPKKACTSVYSLTFEQLIIFTMSKGTVKFFNETKGFGFIIEEDSRKEYFVHVSGLVDKIKENDEVNFEIEEGRKGLNAVNVKLA